MKHLFTIISFRILAVVIAAAAIAWPADAQESADGQEDGGVLIITSFNPETRPMHQNLQAFTETFNRLGNKTPVSVETLNALGLGETDEWIDRMKSIFDDYEGKRKPSVIVLLGQEAWSTFISLEDPRMTDVPTMVALVSRNIIKLPTEEEVANIARWDPPVLDLRTDFSHLNLVGGYAYEYRLRENMALLKRLFPATRNVAILTDNTFGGLNMYAHFRAQMDNYPEYAALYIDGRRLDVRQAADRISRLPNYTVLLAGTWKVDRSNDFSTMSTLPILQAANPSLPVLTVSNVGMGEWAAGGYTPVYGVFGDELAQDVHDYLSTGEMRPVTMVPNHYTFDVSRLHELKIPTSTLPAGAELINDSMPHLPKKMSPLLLAVIGLGIAGIIIVGLTAALIHLHRSRSRVRQELERSQRHEQQARRNRESSRALSRHLFRELQIPLMTIAEFCRMIDDTTTDPTAKTSSKVATAAADELLLTTHSALLLLDTPEAIEETPTETTIGNLCDNAAALALGTKSASVSFQITPTGRNKRVKLPVDFTTAAIARILHNAFKFTPEGDVTLACRVSSDGTRLEVSVSDTGDGIDPKIKDCLGERFKVGRHSRAGVGLGLAVAKTLADFTGGLLKAESLPEGGTRVTLTVGLSQ